MTKTGRKTTYLITALLLITLAAQFTITPTYAATVTLTGTITNQTDQPIPDAKLTVLYRSHGRSWSNRWSNYGSTTTDTQGKYTLQLDPTGDYVIIISHQQDNEYDYIPYGLLYTPTAEPAEKNIQLREASIIQFEGLAYFIETTAIPDTTFRVLEPNSTDFIHYGDLNLIYSQNSGSISSYLNIPSNKVYVPSDQNFRIEVQSYATHSGDTIHRALMIDNYNKTTLQPGETNVIDLRSLVLPDGIATLQNETASVETLINQKENAGFFLAVERQQLSQIKQTTNLAISYMEQGRYDDAFTASRESYVLISDLQNGLNNILLDATRSVYILVGFIAITSIVVASLLFENSKQKLTVSTVLFTTLLLTLYYLHPGAKIADKLELIKVSAASLIIANLMEIMLPRLLSRPSSGREVSFLNMTVPVFSIAKRSLRRRKLRFLLTLTSVLLLVASFISLTSFTSGYGLSFTKTTDSVMKNGVMIRTPDPPPERAVAPFSGGPGVSGPLPLDKSLLQWYAQMNEVKTVVPRYQNMPVRQYRESHKPVALIGSTPIFGMVGIDPMMEAEINHLDSAVAQGQYIGDGAREVMISIQLAQKLGASVGDTFTLTSQEQTFNLTIVGLLNDASLSKLTDIDGKSIMPSKIVEMERIQVEGGPDMVVEALAPCSPDETIWVNLKTGTNMSALYLERIKLILNDNVDAMEFARSTALDRGFRAWASTDKGVYLAELTGYFQGKGLPIVIPWVIVVLNVVVTMMNAYYERRHEVMIYSSIGMNPRHVSSIFLSEAAVIGIVGGCLGYILGLGAYKVIFLLTPALQVKQKVSAFWSVASIGISMMAVLVGGLSALRNSTSITPSLRRRWTIDKKQASTDDTRIVIPVQVYEEEIAEYIDFLTNKLEQAKKVNNMMVKMPKMTKTSENSWEYTFIYSSANAQISALYTKNKLIVEKGEGKTYTTVLYTDGDTESVKQAGSFLRQLGLDWSLQREEGAH